MKNFSRALWLFWAVLLLWQASILGRSAFLPTERHYAQKRVIANRFLLTDYCLSTESRHVRHIALPEPLAPFQDLPAYHDHFPSSAFFIYHLSFIIYHLSFIIYQVFG